jgi:pyruvate dehydrogenase E2 component (dihydrolipoamide acetyltransferase)
MPFELRVPDLGETISSGRLTAWLKSEGDYVRAGQGIVEVETDKTSVEIPAPVSGVLQAILVAANGDEVAVGSILGLIAEGESETVIGSVAKKPAAPVLARSARAPHADHRVVVEAEVRSGEFEDTSGGESADASPLARRMAAIARIELTEIAGTGPGGRVRKNDVLAVLQERQGSAPAVVAARRAARRDGASGTATTKAAVPGPSAEPSERGRPLSAMRRVTAERLSMSKRTIPHFYLRVEVATDRLVQVRADLSARGSDAKLSVTVFAVRAAALALRKVPQANASWADGSITIHKTIDIAVAVTTPLGVITPIVREADRKPLAAISEELHAVSARAREGRLEPRDYTGGTFTISNLGMYGISSLYPIINPPQSCILGIGAIEQRPIVRGDGLAIGHVMNCTLAADHRVIDGAEGAELLGEIRRLLEDPAAMLP